ncbi:LysR family transcriptional regulator [Nakamurella leprariae]|uniref:LysR family transcriptional regulator n=1 Tax=Nakamurella leprariae TaxID=2803911 RepID=A0A939C0K8_9ACTN|nr:LysR family transcriptional regulator [Nakamurella leprariae]MBM9468866.1 LysR family transcriptional regulator [Nakamurella leprariae]
MRTDRLDLDQLALLRELADRGSVTAVAAAVGRTPSAVSQQLKALQRQVGVPLVERVGRGVQLTDAGRALVVGAVTVATALEEAQAGWHSFRGEVGGTVRLASFHSAAELLIPGLLHRLSRYPGLQLDTFDQDVAEQAFAGLTADYDIVVAHRSNDVVVPDRPQLRTTLLLREPMDVGLPLDHPLAQRASVTPQDLDGEAWIVPPPDYPIDRVLTAIAARSGVPVRVVRRTTHLPLIEKLITAGHGIGLLPRHTSAERAAGRFALVPLKEIRAGRVIEALSRPDRAARLAVRTVLDDLVAEAATVCG